MQTNDGREGKTNAGSVEEKIPVFRKPSFMIYYGEVDEPAVLNAMKYDIAILHPKQGKLTRRQVKRIQSAGTKVLGYIAVGEDLRTAGLTPDEMREDSRFRGDGSGPRVDPRAEGDASLDAVDRSGIPSPGGSGFASYYLDDNNRDGLPDFNPVFHCAYTNVGDPAWYEALDKMLMDGEDHVPGVREILTTDYGRGLGCDGLFLDTLDTCAPNAFTTDDNPARTRFEWTAAGAADFMAKIRVKYPDKLICQNRGLFFFHHLLPHYHHSTRKNLDYLLFESYMLDSDAERLYHNDFFADNKYNQLPKLSVEASRPDGFTVLSLGYAEGPEEYRLDEALLCQNAAGRDILLKDLEEADESAGFSHYITDREITALNDFVLSAGSSEDHAPPVWSSVYNDSAEWPPHEPRARVGIGDAKPLEGGAAVYWDVALDKTGVSYVLFYQKKPFDFEADPALEEAEKKILHPGITEEYERGEEDAFPYAAEIHGLESGQPYYMLIRAVDRSENHNMEQNTVYKTVIPE